MPKQYLDYTLSDVLFYRTWYKIMVFIAIFLLICIIGVLGKIYYAQLNIKEQTFFSTSSDGRLIELKAQYKK